MRKTPSQLFDGISLGDVRLGARVNKIVDKLTKNPDQPFPQVFSVIELEAFYRLGRNPRVSADKLVEHMAVRVLEQCEADKEYLVIHDTSIFTFAGRLELGTIEGNVHGFLGHFSLLVEAESASPIGIVHAELWERKKDTPTAARKKKLLTRRQIRELPSEMDRWARTIGSVEALDINKKFSFIHVGDSEVDDYASLSKMIDGKTRFVVRAATNRCLHPDQGYYSIQDKLDAQAFITSIDVPITKREKAEKKSKRHPKRQARTATISIRSTSIKIRRPTDMPASLKLPEMLEFNVVHAIEQNPPEGEQAIEWTLFTSESIKTAEQVIKVIDNYKKRWLIEEFFRALKTGCKYESRQLESFDTLTTVLALLIPIAVNLLHLRALERTAPDSDVSEIMDRDLLRTLEAKFECKCKTVGEAMQRIATLGGHLKPNGPPGYLVLWRGYRELIVMTAGFLLAMKSISHA